MLSPAHERAQGGANVCALLAGRARAVRLLLDEMYSPAIAARLRDRGWAAASLHDRRERLGLADAEVLRLAAAEGRALVTENARDFVPLVRAALLAGDDAPGLVVTSPRTFPLSSRTIGALRDAMAELCRLHPTDDALSGQTAWLTRVDGV